MKMLQGRFQPEKHGRVGAQTVVVDDSCVAELVADGPQHVPVVGYVVATEVGQRCTFAYTAPSRVVGKGQEPRPSGGVHAA